MLRRSLFHIFFLASIVLAIVAGSFVAHAAVHQAVAVSSPLDYLREAGTGYKAGQGEPRDLRLIVAGFIRLALSLIGMIMLVLMLYAGYLWFSARGEEDQVTKAKATIRNAVIGLVLVMMTYSIITFIFRSIFVQDTGSNSDAYDATIEGADYILGAPERFIFGP